MRLTHYYPMILRLHVGCTMVSGSLFASRGILRLANLPPGNHVALRITSYIVDTTLLTAAVLLMMMRHQYPIVDDWLTAKVLLVVLYIALGVMALRQAKTRWGRRAAFGADRKSVV